MIWRIIYQIIVTLQKKTLIVKSDLENLTTDLIMDGTEVKIIYMSLFYFWFTLDAELRGVPHKYFDKSSPFDEMTDIIRLIQQTTFKLPEPKFSTDLQMLNSKVESLSIFYGVSEQEWQKMDYYFLEILNAVRNYISKIIKK